ncbi:MAG TPA: hypothetical protein ENH26_00145 [Candidatus Wolfebacteria bacterium]|nr:hypothetical protein [Candidatus Wolfebacteria bacterium]
MTNEGSINQRIMYSDNQGSTWTYIVDGQNAPTAIVAISGTRFLGHDEGGVKNILEKTTDDSSISSSYTLYDTDDDGFFQWLRLDSSNNIFGGTWTSTANERATIIGSWDSGATWHIVETMATGATHRGYTHASEFDSDGYIYISENILGGTDLGFKSKLSDGRRSIRGISRDGTGADTYKTASLSGTFIVEYIARIDRVNTVLGALYLRDTTTERVNVVFWNDALIKYHNGTDWISTGITYTADTSYEFKYIVNLTAKTWDLWVDGVEKATDIPFRVDGNTANRLYALAGTAQQGTVDLQDIRVREYSATEPSASVGSETTNYVSDQPTIQSIAANSLAFTSLSAFTETATKNSGEIKYILSNDDGSTWYYYNSGWTTSDETYSQSNTASIVNTNISTFPTGDGEFLWKAFLNSNGTQLVQLDNISVAGAPLAATIGTPTALSFTSIRWNFTDNSNDETGFKIYNNSNVLITSDATQNLSYIDETGLSENTQYIRYIKEYNSYGSSASSATTSLYTLADTPTNFSATAGDYSITLSVDSFTNASADSSGYYFSRSDSNSGWITSNSWENTSLSCGTSYTYTVKYRNGDATQTSTASLTQSTNSCGGAGMPIAVFNPPAPAAPSASNLSGGFGVVINNNENITNNRTVILKFFAGSNVKRMAISEDPNFKYASQEPYQETKKWTLSKDNGKKTVYVKFFTEYGIASKVVLDEIVLGSISANQSEQLIKAQIVSLQEQLIKLLNQLLKLLQEQLQ